ncbi:MAG: hypothetical protein ACYSU0_13195 [Planctomycetota bacterium]
MPDESGTVSLSAPTLEPDLDLYEMALREWLPAGPRKEVMLMGFLHDPNADYNDPPAGFLDRFKDLPYRFGVASDARLPQPGEMESEGIMKGIREKASGKPAVIYYVYIKQMTEREIALETGWTGGPLYGSGLDLRATRVDGEWRLTVDAVWAD